LCKVRPGYVWDETGGGWDEAGSVWDESGSVWDETGSVWDETGSVWDETGSVSMLGSLGANAIGSAARADVDDDRIEGRRMESSAAELQGASRPAGRS
jgi:hypothetical protein